MTLNPISHFDHAQLTSKNAITQENVPEKTLAITDQAFNNADVQNLRDPNRGYQEIFRNIFKACQDESGNLVLAQVVSCCYGDCSMVTAALSTGAKADMAALFAAYKSRDRHLVKIVATAITQISPGDVFAALSLAFETGDFQILKRIEAACGIREDSLFYKELTMDQKSELFNKAALSGNVKMLEHASSIGLNGDSKSVETSARSGNLQMVLFLKKQGYLFSDGCLNAALLSGNLDVIKWMVASDRKANRFSFSKVCLSKNEDAVKYYKETYWHWVKKDGFTYEDVVDNAKDERPYQLACKYGEIPEFCSEPLNRIIARELIIKAMNRVAAREATFGLFEAVLNDQGSHCEKKEAEQIIAKATVLDNMHVLLTVRECFKRLFA